MRLVKMSDKHHIGFKTIEGCFAFFNHVLPFNQYYFRVFGTGHYLSSKNDHTNTNFIFQYDKKIVAIAKVKDVSIDGDGRVDGFFIIGDTLKVFEHREPIEVMEIEHILRKADPTFNLSNQGWNIIEEEYESIVIDFLIDKEWGIYKKDTEVNSLSD